MATVVDVTGAKYPTEFNGHEIQPMEGVSLLPAFAGEQLDAQAADLLGARRQPRGPSRQVEARDEAQAVRGSSTTSRPTAPSSTTWRRSSRSWREMIADWEAWAKRADVGPWPGPPRAIPAEVEES